jgi:hypothetical protein
MAIKDIFGLEISKNVRMLCQEIKEKSGYDVEFKDILEVKQTFALLPVGCCFFVDKRPVVGVNLELGLYDENIAHELLHLILGLEGFPGTYVTINDPIASFIAQTLMSSLDHLITFPRLERMGYHPKLSVKDDFTNFLKEMRKEDPYPLFQSKAKVVFLALLYMKYSLETENHNIITRLNTVFENRSRKELMSGNYYDLGKKYGQKLIKTMRESFKPNPEDYKSTFSICLYNVGVPQEIIYLTNRLTGRRL